MSARAASDVLQARAAAEGIVRVLRGAGHVAYFAGGCVRDELLGLAPSDYDVATDATPDRVLSLFPRAGEVGKSFGVVIVAVGREVVEVATFRADGDYSDRRRPDQVRFSTPEEDARRRDYTVNALFLDPLEASNISHGLGSGRVIDLVGGLADLRAGVLRAVGDPEQRLKEDHLRALRAARLAAKLGFSIDPATVGAIRAHASELCGMSRERIGDEVHRMLLHPSRATGAALLASLGLEAPVFQLAGPTLGQRLEGRPPVRLASLEAGSEVGWCLAAWALDLAGRLSPEDEERLVTRWRDALCLSNEDRALMGDVLRGVRLLEERWLEMPEAAQKREAAGRWFNGALQVLGATQEQQAAKVWARVHELVASPSGLAPKPILTGSELIAMGWKPGPRFKTVLDRVYDAQLENRVRSLEEARELAARLGVRGE